MEIFRQGGLPFALLIVGVVDHVAQHADIGIVRGDLPKPLHVAARGKEGKRHQLLQVFQRDDGRMLAFILLRGVSQIALAHVGAHFEELFVKARLFFADVFRLHARFGGVRFDGKDAPALVEYVSRYALLVDGERLLQHVAFHAPLDDAGNGHLFPVLLPESGQQGAHERVGVFFRSGPWRR